MLQTNVVPIANSADPDQTVSPEQSDQGLYCLLKPIFPKILVNYNTYMY